MFHHVCYSDLPKTCPCFHTVEDLFRPSEKLLLTDDIVAQMRSPMLYLAHDGTEYMIIARQKTLSHGTYAYCSGVARGKCYNSDDGKCMVALFPLYKFHPWNGETPTAPIHTLPYITDRTRKPISLLRKHEIGQGLHLQCVAMPLECNYPAHNATLVKKWWRQWKNRFGCYTIEQLRIRVWIVLKWLNGIYPSLCKDIRTLIHRQIFAVGHHS
jgi:hypothetical protein